MRADSPEPGLPQAPFGGVDAYKAWKPEAQQKALHLLQERQNAKWRPFYCTDATCNGQPHVDPIEIKDCPLPFGHEWVAEADAWQCNPERGCSVLGVPRDDWLWTHSRSDQRPPPWKQRWLTWMQAGGRGSGKTRTGSEVTHRVTEVTGHISLIAPTGPDIRETLVEGESGLLATAPPGKRPEWEPSRKRLVWPNGAVARGFSAEEPDRLRGPQCLVAGTMIETSSGPRPIEEIEIGDLVWTRRGLRTVVHAESNLREVMNFGPLRGTPDHPVWTENRGWVRMDSVHPDDTLVTWSPISMRPAVAASSSPRAAVRCPMPAGSGCSTTATPASARSITSTGIDSTTESRILLHSRQRSTETLIGGWCTPMSAVAVAGSSSSPMAALGSGAPTASGHSIGSQAAAPMRSGINGSSPARTVAPSSARAMGRSAPSGASTCGPIERVYDLTVAEDHEFFANGILVHNSGFIWMDEAAHYEAIEDVWSNALFGLRLGNPSHVLVTSTPKPTPWIKKLIRDKKTIHHKVSTYANLANLDPAFREVIIEKYEGTRTGLQELYGELLEDVEGALWHSSMISYQSEEPSTLERVVVSVDPAGSANARSDETGIVVVGWAEKKAYVLADYSGKYSPAGWGAKAWWAHEHFSADRIVAEKNYGGEMVEHVLNTASDDRARVHLVNSRRGKALRAEPIVAQYEKGRVLHVRDRTDATSRPGDLLALEEEMLSWIPGEGASPNRVDALVHGLTDVFKGFAPATVAVPKSLTGPGRGPNDPMTARRGYR